ncbi:MAG: DNA-binding response regulator [Candidatus Kuenenia stuttgartiensis]|nr:DNA-binding response regulator [Candidatus Kuenenia stuttgartiensis]
MDTVNSLETNNIAFINDKSPIIDAIAKDLATSGMNILFRAEGVKDALVRLSALKKLPKVCIIDLDFHDKGVLTQLGVLRTKYPNLKLIIHSDIDDVETVKALSEIGIDGYLLMGSDVDDFKKAIERVKP